MSNSSNPIPDPLAPETVTVAAPKSNSMRWLVPTLVLAATLVVGLFGGVLIGQATASASTASSGFRGGFPGAGNATGRPGGGFGGGGFTTGTITTVNADSIVITTAAGATVTIKTSPTTTITQTTPAVITDFKPGQTVTAIGQPDASGTITATTIAEGQRLGGGFRNGGAPTPAPTP
jgi:hypothetical protein